jgi:hypothetical protein
MNDNSVISISNNNRSPPSFSNTTISSFTINNDFDFSEVPHSDFLVESPTINNSMVRPNKHPHRLPLQKPGGMKKSEWNLRQMIRGNPYMVILEDLAVSGFLWHNIMKIESWTRYYHVNNNSL